MSVLPREEIRDILEAAQRELALRQTVAAYSEQLQTLQSQYRDATRTTEAEQFVDWELPEYALDAYAVGDTVVHSGGNYRSLIPCNFLEPGVAGWRQVNKDGSPRQWAEPAREHDAYTAGEKAVYGGKTYECVGDCVVSPPNEDDTANWKLAE